MSMSEKSIPVLITPRSLSNLLGTVADQIIDHNHMTPEVIEQLNDVGQKMIIQMMSNHDYTFAQGIVCLIIMLESMFMTQDMVSDNPVPPPCPSKDHIN